MSPNALSKLLETPDAKTAFSPSPTILPATDILFDSWALTSIMGEPPGRPEVEPYLHGVAEWEPPETHMVWRADIRDGAYTAAMNGAGVEEKHARLVAGHRNGMADHYVRRNPRCVEAACAAIERAYFS